LKLKVLVHEIESCMAHADSTVDYQMHTPGDVTGGDSIDSVRAGKTQYTAENEVKEIKK
jgi:hypothetical protein